MKKIQIAVSLYAAMALFAQSVIAQDAGSTGSGASLIEELVVTAQKRESNLQDTAIAIFAFSGESLENKGIDDISNLQSYIPNLHVGQEQDGFKIALRGVGIQGTSSITDPGVAFYQDGMYIPRPAGGSAIFYDISRIEVLRGPQGTLYGRNATGGVVNVIANEPSQEFEAKVGISYGSRDLLEMRGMVNFPVNEQIASRFSVVYTEEDGYHENISTAPDTDDFYGTDGDLSLRGQLLYEDLNGFDILLSASYSDLDGTGVPMTFTERNIGGPGPTQALLATIGPQPSDPLVSNNDNEAFNDTETLSTFFRIEKSFDSFDAFLQAGFFSQDTHIIQDFDGSDVPISIFTKQQDNEAHSVEFRLSSNSDSRLQWILGAYYFSEETHIFRRVQLNGLVGGGTVFINLPDFLLDEWGDSKTVAGFGSATYSITDEWRVTGGIRYTSDEKTGALLNTSNFGAPTRPPLPNATFDADESFSETTWKAGLEWDASESALAYLNISSGYKAGGFNITSNGVPYDPETILAYEIGLKSNPFDGRVQFNVDAFYYDYTDMQLSTLTVVNGAPGQFTSNAAEAEVYGLEIDTKFQVNDSLLLSLGYSYIKTEFAEYFNTDPRDPSPVFNPGDPSGLGRADLSGNRLPYTPEHTLSLGIQYELELGNNLGRIVSSLNTSWHDELFMREYNLVGIDKQSANTKTDISVTYYAPNSGLTVTAYATNLEDDHELANVYISPGFVGLNATQQYTKPRSFGVKFDYTF